jgi:carbon-monoxide dehydrogenase medium subunit
MRPAPFEYVRPTELGEVLALLAEYRERAAVLAGGQSLVAQLNARRRSPELVIDIASVAELGRIDRDAGLLRVGAMVTQRGLQRAAGVPDVLVEALNAVGHVPTRNRGTLGGSIAFADPAAELPTTLLALDGAVTVCSAAPPGRRTVPAAELFAGPFRTVLGPDELITEVLLPLPEPGTSWAFEQRDFRRHAKVSVVAGRAEHGPLTVAAGGLAGTPVRLDDAEALLDKAQSRGDGIAAIADALAELVAPNADHYGSPNYRRQLVRVASAAALHRVLPPTDGSGAAA